MEGNIGGMALSPDHRWERLV